MIYYLGSFPPGYGGVTVKNMNLFDALSQKEKIGKVDFNKIKRKNLKELFRLIGVFFSRKHVFVIGVSGKATRRLLTQFLYRFNRKTMRKSIIMIMGGVAAKIIAADPAYQKYMAAYRKIYVETKGMLQTLQDAGLKNAQIYPNGRFKVKEPLPDKTFDRHPLKLLYFSQVSKQKGADTAFDAAKLLEEKGIDYRLDFYGKVEPTYQQTLEQRLKENEKTAYLGIYNTQENSVYTLMRQYDVMLFASTWESEGAPGCLIEALIAGLPSIVTDWNFNADIVENGFSGVVLQENTSECLADAIEKLEKDRTLLKTYSENCAVSAEKYYIENYIDEIYDQLKKGENN